MAVSTERLDALLHLGERIAEAVKSDDWGRVADLLDRRARIVEALAPRSDDETDGGEVASTDSGSEVPRGTLRQKKKALADQHDTLLSLLREREEEIEAELGQMQRVQSANDSYANDSYDDRTAARGGREGVLPPELSG